MNREMKAGVCLRVALSREARRITTAAALRDDIAIRRRLILAAGEFDNDVLRRLLKRCITD